MIYELTLDEFAGFWDCATVEQSIDLGHAIVHIGRNAHGVKFVLTNTCEGQTTLVESST